MASVVVEYLKCMMTPKQNQSQYKNTHGIEPLVKNAKMLMKFWFVKYSCLFYACEGEYIQIAAGKPTEFPWRHGGPWDGGVVCTKASSEVVAKSEVFFCKESSVDLVETWLCTLEPFFEHVALGNLATKN